MTLTKLTMIMLIAIMATFAPNALAGKGKKKKEKGKEEQVAIKDVPKAVMDTVKKFLPGLKIEEAEKETKGAVVTYEIEGKVGDKEYEIEVRADGTLVKLKLEEDDDDDDDEDDGDNNDDEDEDDDDDDDDDDDK